ncbi:6887_t:CDS:2, partial [Dentiscutata heterogama]
NCSISVIMMGYIDSCSDSSAISSTIFIAPGVKLPIEGPTIILIVSFGCLVQVGTPSNSSTTGQSSDPIFILDNKLCHDNFTYNINTTIVQFSKLK